MTADIDDEEERSACRDARKALNRDDARAEAPIQGLQYVELNKVSYMSIRARTGLSSLESRSSGDRPASSAAALSSIVASYNKFELRPAVSLQVPDNERRSRRTDTTDAAVSLYKLRSSPQAARVALSLFSTAMTAPQNEVAPLPRGDEALRALLDAGSLSKKTREIGLRRAPGARREL